MTAGPLTTQTATTASATSRRSLAVRMFEPVPIGFLVFFRIAFGGIMLWEAFRYFQTNWIGRNYAYPKYHFTFYGFDWIRPWPGEGMYWHFVLLGLAATGITLGWCYRIAAVTFFVGFTYVFLIDQTFYLNHFYLVCLISFLMIFLPANRSLSLDVRQKPEIRSDTVPAWTLWLLRLQVGIPYFYGGIAKLNADWLQGFPIRGTLLQQSDLPVVGSLLGEESMVYVFVWSGLLFDLLVVPLMLWRRTRVITYCAVLSFHLTNAAIFRIGIFPWFMILATLIYFPPERFRLPWKGREESDATDATQSSGGMLLPKQKLILGLLGTYVAIQLLMPFRHFLYPGNVSWTEEGHLYAWHMKLRQKGSVSRFYALTADGQHIDEPDEFWLLSQPAEGMQVHPRALRPTAQRQRYKMSGRPEMILQYAHWMAEELRAQGHDVVAVHADVHASLNGRRPQWLIDPEVNLMEQRSSIWPANWIRPLTTPLPPVAEYREMVKKDEGYTINPENTEPE